MVTFPVPLVEHVQRPEAPAAVERVMHEVHRPYLWLTVGRWCRQGLPEPRRDASLGSAGQMEPQGPVHVPERLWFHP